MITELASNCTVCGKGFITSLPAIENYVCLNCKKKPEVEQFLYMKETALKLEENAKDVRRKEYITLLKNKLKFEELEREFKDEII